MPAAVPRPRWEKMFPEASGFGHADVFIKRPSGKPPLVLKRTMAITSSYEERPGGVTAHVHYDTPEAQRAALVEAKDILKKAVALGIYHPDTLLRIGGPYAHAQHYKLWARMPLLHTYQEPSTKIRYFEDWLSPEQAASARRQMREKIALIERHFGRPNFDARVENNWGVDEHGNLYLHDLHLLERFHPGRGVPKDVW